MAIEGNFDTDTVVAGADLSAMQYKVISIAGVMAASNLTAYGVLQNAPLSGEHATLAVRGKMKAKAGGTITKGAPLVMTASGTLQVGSQGIVGKALAAASSGAVFPFNGDFSRAF